MKEIEFDIIETYQTEDGSTGVRRRRETRQFTEERHCDWCTACDVTTYPKCMEWCEFAEKYPLPPDWPMTTNK